MTVIAGSESHDYNLVQDALNNRHKLTSEFTSSTNIHDDSFAQCSFFLANTLIELGFRAIAFENVPVRNIYEE